jgi:phosphoglycolate phosphatase
MVEHPKPKGDMLKFSCEKLQILKENSIMVGDSKKDLNAAKDFGIRCVLVNWGFSEHQENEGTNIVHDVVGLINEIDKINMRDKI